MINDRILIMFKPLFVRSPPQLPPPLSCACEECYDERYLLYAGPKLMIRGNGVGYKVFIVHGQVLKHFMYVVHEHL